MYVTDDNRIFLFLLLSYFFFNVNWYYNLRLGGHDLILQPVHLVLFDTAGITNKYSSNCILNKFSCLAVRRVELTDLVSIYLANILHKETYLKKKSNQHAWKICFLKHFNTKIYLYSRKKIVHLIKKMHGDMHHLRQQNSKYCFWSHFNKVMSK